MLKTILDDISPIPSEGPGFGDVINNLPAAGYVVGMAQAVGYSAAQGLVTPMRSSIYRSLKADAYDAFDALGDALPQIAAVAVSAHGLANAVGGAVDGTCH